MGGLGDRIKNNYENRSRYYLTRRTPVIIRLDGKAFHTLTRKCDKPFDKTFMSVMVDVAIRLCKEIQGARLAYVQSDEISILLTDYSYFATEAWFDYNIQKMTSISSAIASVAFTQLFKQEGYFDSRVFNIPREEVVNYFIWRQKDWERNSLMMYARSVYSHKELYKKGKAELHEMLHAKSLNWAKDLTVREKNGSLIVKCEEVAGEGTSIHWGPVPCPIFTEDSELITKELNQIEE